MPGGPTCARNSGREAASLSLPALPSDVVTYIRRMTTKASDRIHKPAKSYQFATDVGLLPSWNILMRDVAGCGITVWRRRLTKRTPQLYRQLSEHPTAKPYFTCVVSRCLKVANG
jgi:hypothetical protein